MSTRSHSIKIFFLAVLVVLLSSLACGFDTGNDNQIEEISLQQTLVALQATQKALENQAADSTSQPVEETIPPAEAEPIQPTQAPIETVQEPDVSFEGIHFSLDPNIANGTFPVIVPAKNMGEDFMPGDTYPTHFEFTFESYAVGDHFHTPKILVYPVEEYRAISPTAADIIDDLAQTLLTKPGGGTMSNLPFLPIWPAAQIFSAQVAYFDFENGSGLRYLTMFGQGLSPIDNQNLFYTFQGLTEDGRYYISAVLPVTHLSLPDDGASEIQDWADFTENWEDYIAETITWLQMQGAETFTPNLALLDEMMASFVIDR